MSDKLLLVINVLDMAGSRVRFKSTLEVDADLMHPADDPAITLQGVQTAIDYVLREEAKR